MNLNFGAKNICLVKKRIMKNHFWVIWFFAAKLVKIGTVFQIVNFKNNCSIFIKIVLKETVLCHFEKMIINYMKIGSLRRFWQVFKEEDLAEKKKEMWSSRFSFATLLRLLFWLKNGGRHSSVEISFRSSEHKLCNKTFQTLKIHDTEFVSWFFNLSNWNKKPNLLSFSENRKN